MAGGVFHDVEPDPVEVNAFVYFGGKPCIVLAFKSGQGFASHFIPEVQVILYRLALDLFL